MLNLFIVLKGLLSPKIALPEFSGLFYFKTKANKRKLPGRVNADSLSGYSSAFPFICHCERPTRALQEDPFCTKLKFQQKEAWQSSQSAFSLVEMLMALLVASLLLAALAPVMTRRMADHELKVLSEASNYEKDMVVSVFTESTKFNIPSDANQVRVTLMGGGGKGGDALYGNKEIASNETFTVPDNVTKLRVFMIGGGGGGASGGLKKGTEYADIPENEVGTSSKTYYVAGNGTSTNTYTFSSNVLAPALNEKCSNSGVNSWTCASNSASVPPNSIIPTSCGYNFRFKATACGGSGGGGWGSNLSGAGGYLKDVEFQTTSTTLYVTVGGGGGSGSLAREAALSGGYGAGGGGGALWGAMEWQKGGAGGTHGGSGGWGGSGGGSSTTSSPALARGGATGSAGGLGCGNGGSFGGIWGGSGGGGGCGKIGNTVTSGDGGGGGGGGGPTTIATASG